MSNKPIGLANKTKEAKCCKAVTPQRAYHRHRYCTFNMRASGPVHPGWIRLTVSPPISSMTFLQSSQSVPVGRVRAQPLKS